MQDGKIRGGMWLVGFRSLILIKRVYRKYRQLRPIPKMANSDAPVRLAPKQVPQIVWMFWAQGEETAPAIVRACIGSWRLQNPGWEVRLLNKQSVAEFVEVDDIPADVSFSHFSDIIRVRLLERYGGVWADATCYCIRPLDQWLTPLMQGGFFAFGRPHPDRLIASWFLASEPGGLIVRTWAARISAYWHLTEKADHYLWLHYLFEWTVRLDPAFRRAWAQVPHVSADGPHLLRRCFEAGIDPATLSRTAVDAVPLYKLTWKTELPADELRKWSVEVQE